MFQSPSGVQIAFEEAVKNAPAVMEFQSPSGVQIALVFLAARAASKGFVFQSPSGVQIALPVKMLKTQNPKIVSITKRCTDCFLMIFAGIGFGAFQSPSGVQIAFRSSGRYY